MLKITATQQVSLKHLSMLFFFTALKCISVFMCKLGYAYSACDINFIISLVCQIFLTMHTSHSHMYLELFYTN